MTRAERDELHVRRTYDFAQSLGARSLGLLRAIEQTLQVVSLDIRVMEGLATEYDTLLRRMKSDPPGRSFDPEGAVVARLRLVMGVLTQFHGVEKSRLRSAESDKELCEADGVAESFRDYLGAIERAHDVVSSLADWIEEHDADFEQPLPGKFETVEGLVAAMKKGA